MKIKKDLPSIFEEFGEQRKKSFLEIKKYKEKNIPIIGMYCAYFPAELALAIDAIPIGLCSFSEETIAAAERVMPKTVCPLVKSSYGFAVEDKCPFFYFADVIIGETTCDGKKKMYELMEEFKEVHVMHLPHSQTEESLKFWRQEIIRTKEYLEEHFQKAITEKKLQEAIKLNNSIRKALKRLYEVMKLQPAPISGMDLHRVLMGSKYRFDFQNTPEIVNQITDQILKQYYEGKIKKEGVRILVTGCPIGGDTEKVIKAIEDNGGVVVAFESCSGAKSMDRLIDEEDPDPYMAMAKRYLNIGCAIMTPNDCRIDLINRLIEEFHVQGIVEMILSGCHSAGIESSSMRQFVNEEKNIPYLMVDTTYSSADYGQINTRIGAFIEMIAETGEDSKGNLDMDYCYQIAFQAVTKQKSIESLIEELYQYTKVPMFWEDKKHNIFISKSRENSIYEYWVDEIEDTQVKFGVLKGGNQVEVLEQIMDLLRQIYFMMQEPQKKTCTRSSQEPDYLSLVFHHVEEDLQKVVINYVERQFSVVQWWNEESNVLCVLDKVRGEEGRKALIKDLEEKEFPCKIGVGNLFENIADSEREKDIVSLLLVLGEKFDVKENIYKIEDYYMELGYYYAAQALGENGWRIRELEILLNEDEEKGTELYKTLFHYLANGKNTTQTAKILEIHRNTLLHRISQIQELLKEDLGNEELSRRLYSAMVLREMQKV